MRESKCAIVYTDGSCIPNPGMGGWGFISIDPMGDWYVNDYEYNTTNNRMELLAIIEAIKFHETSERIKIHTDSKYCEDAIKGKTQRKKNIDLWKEYDRVAKNKKITIIKVKAHSGIKYNDLVDKLAKNAILKNKK